MTKDDSMEHLIQACDGALQPQLEEPFQIVLVDIDIAANHGAIICVEKPLELNAEELNFVALSYRWGELQEQVIDTHLDYLATITSFDLDDLFKLCKMMTFEPDMESIQYLWVDAICVDQTNYERRKATIHRMSEIYEKATYILAVPDLHKQHLMNVSLVNHRIWCNAFYEFDANDKYDNY
ncbi:hypothetical protein BCR42DRAFT_152521 [Absidia repens]|uniref:Heterokaryon incompatibility domain-containing protein n=1 Tax=Absidia repens TaxID=90262 RepID=A0A1X2I1B1_9FUNG|nr:hypothetical protein BCR42DRAFT_152521 [Absidia repens]